MATLVSPGVSVSVTNDSFFIPATAPTVPLYFIATADYKVQQDGQTPAIGTQESNVVRTITSTSQLQQMYGVPRFLYDSSGNPQHGDCRSEWGLAALYEYFGLGSLAYVVRADVNLDDNYNDVVTLWDTQVANAATILQNNISSYLTTYNNTNGYAPGSDATAGSQTVDYSGTIVGTNSIGTFTSQTYTATIAVNGVSPPHTISIDLSTLNNNNWNQLIAAVNQQLGGAAEVVISGGNLLVSSVTTGSSSSILITDTNFFSALPGYVNIDSAVAGQNGYVTTVSASELISLVNASTTSLFSMYSFQNLSTYLISDQHSSPLNVYGHGFNSPPTTTYPGLTYIANNIADLPGWPGGGTVYGQFTPQEGAQLLQAAAADLVLTTQFVNAISLGSNDAARRVAITTALISSINSNTEIRSENFQYNLILCPGYQECVPAMVQLSQDINEEAFVIGDTPCNLSPDGISNPTTGWAMSTARVISNDVAYYYPWGLSTNLDGRQILVSPSGIAGRTYAYNDNVSFLWFAPAGVNRGLVDPNVTDLGYITGTLGTSNVTFVSTHLNQGQRDALYQYAASGGINPIVFFPGYGFLIWGQKTSTGLVASALDRVNATRLIMYIRRQLRINSMPFVFQQNDQPTRDSLSAMASAFLNGIVTNRGLNDYALLCNSSNNPPSVVQANEMFLDVAVQITPSMEFLYIPITVVSLTQSLTQSG